MIRVTPDKPLTIEQPFDHVSLWCYGSNWGFARDPGTPPVELLVVFAGEQGEVKVSLGRVNWKEWHLLYRGLTAEQQAALSRSRPLLGSRFSTARTGRPRAVLRQPGGLHRTASAAAVRAAQAAQHRASVGGRIRG
ncbi:MAG: hypothetical protein M5U09_28175 [Gammaproteobacteria bacterium]|nr:hypothetical protein [Gammaproteobacteria bacterium]